MAFSKQERRELVDAIVSGDSALPRKSLFKLTDNQLVSLADPQQLDFTVNELSRLKKEKDEEDPTDNEDKEQDRDDEDPTDNEDEYEDEEDPTDNEDEAEEDEEDPPKGKVPPQLAATNKKKGPTGNSRRQRRNQLSDEQWLRLAPKSIQRLVTNAQQRENEEREQLTDLITANSRNQFDEDQLYQMPLETLRGIAALSHGNVVSYRHPTGNASGRRSLRDEAPLVAPSMPTK